MLCLSINAFGERERQYGVEQEERSMLHWFGSSVPLVALFRGIGLIGPVIDVNEVDYDPIAQMSKRSYLRALTQGCKRTRDCTVTGDKVEYPGTDFSFRVTLDPSVIEIVSSPFKVSTLRKLRDQIQRDMFTIPGKLGIRPPKIATGGHLHMDVDIAFGRDPLKLLNFVIDYVNHSELSTGAFLYDPFEAPTPLRTPTEREAFRKIIAEYDAGGLRTWNALIDRLDKAGFHKISSTGDKCALNVKTKYNTVEFRAARAYQSIDHLIKMVELQDKRLDMLETKTERIAYLDAGPIMSVEQGVAQFHDYVTGAGGDYAYFKDLLPDYWQRTRVKPELAFQTNPRGTVPFRLKCKLLFTDLFIGMTGGGGRRP